MNKKWWFLDTSWSAGPANMATEEAILNYKINHPEAPPTLRVFGWSPPCVSLGRTQPFNDMNLVKCRELGIYIVRRLTGGTAILHDRELTYSIIISQNDGIPFNIVESFRTLNQGLILAYRKLGVPVELITRQQKDCRVWCFASQGIADLAYQGKKIVGSAQYRRGTTILQHGSLIIRHNLKLMSELAPEILLSEATDLETIRGKTTLQEIKTAIRQGFEEALDIEFSDGDLR